MNAAFLTLKVPFGIITAASLVGLAATIIALFASSQLKDTYAKDLEFIEGL